jgi:hypothetical protein
LADRYQQGVEMFTISNAEVFTDVVGEAPTFPKYTTQLLNLANQNAQGTRPRIVGQMSELIHQFPGKAFSDWQVWYAKTKPSGIEDATERVYSMVSLLKKAISLIDREMVRTWVQDLVLNKSFIGLRFQESVLRRVAQRRGVDYQASTPEQESQGIDGFIGGKPVSVKPTTYKLKAMLPENLTVEVIWYEKLKNGIRVQDE